MSFHLLLQLNFPIPRRPARYASFEEDFDFDLNTSRRDSYLKGLTLNCLVVGASFGEWKD